MKTVYKNRLLKLARLLREDAANLKGVKFDLGYLVDLPSDPDVPLWSCGTTACAVGLAAVSGAFKAQGLRLDTSRMGNVYIEGEEEAYGVGAARWSCEKTWIDAAQTLFGLSRAEVAYLFTDDPYVVEGKKTYGAKGERNVAKRIEGVAERGFPADVQDRWERNWV